MHALNKDIKIHKIGIDLDNTIICYDLAFQLAARKFRLIDNHVVLPKESLRNQIRKRKNGEEQWQKLQGYVYGKGILNAEIFPGLYRFLWRCHKNKVKVEIVSHKTKYGHFDADKTSLRDASNNFLSDKNIINSSIRLINKITYTDSLKDKLNYIKRNNFDWFVDDLVEVADSILVDGQKSILFSPGNQINKLYGNISNSWEEIENLLFGSLTLDEIKLLSKLLLNGAHVKDVIQLRGRGNSSVYKVLTVKKPIFFKVYPQVGKHRRLESEVNSTSVLNNLGMNEIQKTIAFNKELNIAAYEWIDGDNPQIFDVSTIEKSLHFLQKLHDKRGNHLFDNFSMASDSCTSAYEIERQINQRLSQLNDVSDGSEILFNFLDNEFTPFLKQVIEWSKSQFLISENYYKPIEREEMTLSPSDFGFHNILVSKNGGLKFIDFEYFGWDDPVKLASDFSHHVAMNLTDSMERQWFQGVKDIYGDSILSRLKASWPLYGLNWCLIILNEFKSDVWVKRCLVNQEIKHNREDVLLDQLTKSRNKLKYISECYKDKEFW